jgi:hypothetical protein
MQNDRQRIELVKAGHNPAIFDVCETADMQDEVGAPAIDGNMVAGFFNVTIGKAERLASLS